MKTDFFAIVASILLGDTFAPYLIIICLDHGLKTLIDLMKQYGYTLERARSRWYPKESITDSDYANDITLIANIPT